MINSLHSKIPELEHFDNALDSVEAGTDNFLIHFHLLLSNLQIALVHQSRQGDATVDAGEKEWMLHDQ